MVVRLPPERHFCSSYGWSCGCLGLFNWFRLPLWAELPLGFILLDVTFYYWHRVNHSWPLLWRFHNVHHIDVDMDVSTAVRFHFGEIALSTVFHVLQLGLLGVSTATFLFFELCFAIATMFHHSNWRLPFNLELNLNKILVTPRMHTIHHSVIQRETNSNYATVFSWWDRLHGTFQALRAQPGVTIGVPAYQDRRDQTFSRALLLPFQRQRDYWSPASTHTNSPLRSGMSGSN
jgi:sterol desaturase/sphingolipid hydroxylase (fatty acid hydroxylase superfamily)